MRIKRIEYSAKKGIWWFILYSSLLSSAKWFQRIYFFRRFQMSEFTFKDNQAEDVGLIINVFMFEYFIMQVFVERWMYPALSKVTVCWFWSRRDTRNILWRIRQPSYLFLDMRVSSYLVWCITEFGCLFRCMKYDINLQIFIMFYIFRCTTRLAQNEIWILQINFLQGQML
jgi:hypothetical protein